MAFSTTHPCPIWGALPGADALYDAWKAIREARHVPWDADHAALWRAEFARNLAIGFERFSAHVRLSEAPGSALRSLASQHASSGWLRSQFADDEELLGQLQQLLAEVEQVAHPEIEHVVQFSEEAVMLEMKLAMHQNRLHELLEQQLQEPPRGLAIAR